MKAAHLVKKLLSAIQIIWHVRKFREAISFIMEARDSGSRDGEQLTLDTRQDGV